MLGSGRARSKVYWIFVSLKSQRRLMAELHDFYQKAEDTLVVFFVCFSMFSFSMPSAKTFSCQLGFWYKASGQVVFGISKMCYPFLPLEFQEIPIGNHGFLLGSMLVVLCFLWFFRWVYHYKDYKVRASNMFKWIGFVTWFMQLGFVPRPISNRDPTESHDFLQLIR